MPITVDLSDDNHCVHGAYVGGCGIDWMCGRCEMGDGPDILPELHAGETYAEETQQRTAHVWLTWLHVMDAGNPELFAHIAQQSSEVPKLADYLSALTETR